MNLNQFAKLPENKRESLTDKMFERYQTCKEESVKSLKDRILTNIVQINNIKNEYIPKENYESNPYYSPSNPWDAPGMSITNFI